MCCDSCHVTQQASRDARKGRHVISYQLSINSTSDATHVSCDLAVSRHVMDGVSRNVTNRCHVVHGVSCDGTNRCHVVHGVSCDGTNRCHVVQQVFCEEAGSDAGYFRQFVAASYGRFWARYAPRLGQRPHCYEVCPPFTPIPPPCSAPPALLAHCVKASCAIIVLWRSFHFWCL